VRTALRRPQVSRPRAWMRAHRREASWAVLVIFAALVIWLIAHHATLVL
jgi:hypothetical protein